MPRQLLCLRHAKSSWESPGLSDHDRTLNARGRAAALFLGEWMAKQDLLPDLVLCSSAERTQETWQRLSAAFPITCEIIFTRELYLASSRAMLAQIQQAPKRCQRLLLIGHNPGMEMLIEELADPQTSNPQALGQLQEKFPTAALAQLEWAGDNWADLRPNTAVFKQLDTARALMSPT